MIIIMLRDLSYVLEDAQRLGRKDGKALPNFLHLILESVFSVVALCKEYCALHQLLWRV